MIKKVEVELLTEITFNMEDLLKSMIQDAINRGYTTNEDIIDFIENEKPARSCVAVRQLPKNVLCEVEVIAYLG